MPASPVLRVLTLTSNFPRWEGDSTTPFVRHLCDDLVELGWEVDVLAPHAEGAALEETMGALRVERFRYAWPESAQTVCYQGGALVNLRKRAREKWKLPMLVAAEWARVQALLFSGRYDVLHSHWILPQGFVGALASLVSPIPHVVTIHGGDLFSLRGKTLERFKRFSLSRASAVTVNSSFTEAETRRLAPGLSRLERIPMGVATHELGDVETRYRDELRRRFAGGPPVALFLGRLVEEKGVHDFVEAIRLLLGAGFPVRGLIVGEGQDRSRVDARIRELGLSSSIDAVGWVEPQLVRATMAACDLFVGPSKRAVDGWIEAQGLTFLEAMTVGVPVVATRSGGIVDSVRDGETGWSVEEGNPEDLARGMREALSESGERLRRAERARELVKERFSRASSAAAFDRLFRAEIERALAV